MDGNFSKNVIFSDEAHFQLDGYVDTLNYRIWGAENPRVIHFGLAEWLGRTFSKMRSEMQ